MTPAELIALAREAGMIVTTEMKWQQEKWDGLTDSINDQLREAQVKVLREAAYIALDDDTAQWLLRMGDELEKQP